MLPKFHGKKIKNLGKEDFKFPNRTEEYRKWVKISNLKFIPLIDTIKEVLGARVTDVRLSERLVVNPAAVVSGKKGKTANQLRLEYATIAKSRKID